MGRPVRGCGMARLPAADGDPCVERAQGGVVERHDPLGVQLAQRHLQPGAVAGEIPQAVEFEVEQLTQTQPCTPQQRDPAAGGEVVQPGDRGEQRGVDVGRQRAGQRLRQPRGVAAVQQHHRWPLGPAPGGEVVEEQPQVMHGAGVMTDRDRLSMVCPAVGYPAGVEDKKPLQLSAG
jgi:hypothetical protein